MSRDALVRYVQAAKVPAAIVIAGGLVATAVWMTRPRARPSASGEGDAVAAESGAPSARDPSRFRDGARPRAESDPEASDREAAPAERDPATGRGSDPAQAIAPPLPIMPAVPTAVVARVTEQARAAFERKRSDVRTCWEDLPDDPEAPASVELDLSISYGTDGHVLASGVSERRDGTRPGLAACVQSLVHELEVEPPGEHLAIQLTVTVP